MINLIHENLSFFTVKFSLVSYFVVFIILLKIRSVRLVKTWFIPLFALYSGLVTASLFHVFLDGSISSLETSGESLFTLISDVFLLDGWGYVLYGGYFGLIIGIVIINFVTRQKSLSTFLDISAISNSLLFAIWRISCFVSGCCFGMPNKILGISFRRGTDAFKYLKGTDLVVGDATVPLLPTQLISCFGDFAIFLFLLFLFCRNKTRYPYFYLFAHALLYGIGRFTVEFFRIDPREFWGPLSMSQWISLVLVAAGLVFFIKNRKEIAESFRNSKHNL